MTSPTVQPVPTPPAPVQNQPLDSYEPGVYELTVDNFQQTTSAPDAKVRTWKDYKRGDLIDIEDPSEVERLWLGNAIAEPGQREQAQAEAAAAFAAQAQAQAEAAQAKLDAAKAEVGKRNEAIAAKRGPGRPPKEQTPPPAPAPAPTPPPAQ
jgi:hypothetical protein